MSSLISANGNWHIDRIDDASNYEIISALVHKVLHHTIGDHNITIPTYEINLRRPNIDKLFQDYAKKILGVFELDFKQVNNLNCKLSLRLHPASRRAMYLPGHDKPSIILPASIKQSAISPSPSHHVYQQAIIGPAESSLYNPYMCEKIQNIKTLINSYRRWQDDVATAKKIGVIASFFISPTTALVGIAGLSAIAAIPFEKQWSNNRIRTALVLNEREIFQAVAKQWGITALKSPLGDVVFMPMSNQGIAVTFDYVNEKKLPQILPLMDASMSVAGNERTGENNRGVGKGFMAAVFPDEKFGGTFAVLKVVPRNWSTPVITPHIPPRITANFHAGKSAFTLR
ncbi:MAG: hypothetical protein AB7H77_01750 [Bdellovibrionales bacterium]